MARAIDVHRKRAPFAVYIGRPGPWGNPFKVKEWGREGAIGNYRLWFLEGMDQEELRARAVRELTGKVLGCYCSPKKCHGDVLAEYVNRKAAGETVKA